MKIGIIGATGFVGNAVFNEALSRNHEIVAISRLNRVKEEKNVSVVQETIFNEENLKNNLKDVDVIISAYNPGYFHVDQHNRYLEGYEIIVNIAKSLNKRLIMVLGATSLKLPDGQDFNESYSFEGVFKKSMSGPRAIYDLYVNDKSFNWTMVSPAAILFNGVKTKKYNLGTDTLIVDKYNDSSKISVQDLADAILNEVENPQFVNKRFTLGYKEIY